MEEFLGGLLARQLTGFFYQAVGGKIPDSIQPTPVSPSKRSPN
jgi:hypothetical protein